MDASEILDRIRVSADEARKNYPSYSKDDTDERINYMLGAMTAILASANGISLLEVRSAIDRAFI